MAVENTRLLRYGYNYDHEMFYSTGRKCRVAFGFKPTILGSVVEYSTTVLIFEGKAGAY
jgi:hypothetical protein